ncbi:hypothetical protein J6590_108351 [Homalodisca vitripennis]|nr:hypothetical protein J6590_108351 [Homalodisca vitripennis]
MNGILDIGENVNFDDSVINIEWHSHNPYSSNSLKNSDEIRIPVHQQDVYTLPSRSFLLIEGKIIKAADNSDDITTELVNNAMSFLFDEIRYELCGTEIDRVKNVGITTTMKNILTSRPSDVNWMENAGWKITSVENLSDKTNFSFCVPLKLLLGFVEDYNHILLNVKQELVLLRASSDKNAIIQSGASLHDFKINLTKVIWKVPYVQVEDNIKLSLLKVVDKDQPISIPFRRWQLNEYLSLPASQFQTWTVKTSSVMEKPRYVILGFQTNRKDNAAKNASHFDFCSLENVKLYLNSKYYPYDNLNGNKSLMYDLYTRFQSSYYS